MSDHRLPDGQGPELEKALVDILRVGLTGDTPGLRQLGRRLIRKAPGQVEDVKAFRQAVGAVLNSVPATGVGFRSATEIPADSESLMPLLRIETPDLDEGLVLARPTREAVERLIRGRKMAGALTEAGLQPVRSALLNGPPGVGKTMTARYIAAHLGLPLVTVDLASLMSSFLGKTGQNLRSALTYGRENECVFFLDEFDAIAKRRDDEADVGELKRLVNVLLLELDRWPASSLLVAATNHPELLDRAVNRRFDEILPIALPAQAERESILGAVVGSLFSLEPTPAGVIDVCARLTEGLSASELVRLATGAARSALINSEDMSSTLLRASLAAGEAASFAPGVARDRLCGLCRTLLGYSDRSTASLLGVSHPTVAKAIARWRTRENVPIVIEARTSKGTLQG